MRGPKPKPTVLKMIAGNPGKRPLPTNEPKPTGEVVRPSFVRGKAKKYWDLRAATLEELGILTSIDVEMFGVWCCLMAEFHESPAAFGPSKMAHLRGLAASFGMDASARVRLGTVKKEKALDPAEELLANG